ncbi:hypothetical protein HJC06_30325 [Rhizobium sp. NLR9b]|uniref:hypothetical protein n=1 Tax=Rhizobium TaxID=379 RepID=UPI001C8322F2|nr:MULTISPECIES: hypothetical protein [Rhizobium]MBX5155346.1 hypothetical protein [Rhizobium lentis]MBX5179732.1 hypothetical protein [Rhizobium lentis]MBX5230640.1 hypothetical protein [Rhizobium sp. NLR9b]MBX5291308.1 hypothetical protein [Rhizobium sp. NLR10b]
MTNYTTRKSAEALFRAPAAEAGSNAEKLLNLRTGMRLRKRELRDSERTVREAARPFRHPSAGARPLT